MFARVRESISNRATTTRRPLRRRLKAGVQPTEHHHDDDNLSVHSTITVETVRTATNENRKPTADPNLRLPTQVFCGPSHDPSLDPTEVLERAQSDITKLSIYMQQINLTRLVASSFMGLVRGDNRSWEAIAVDILRQKARWDNITLEDCEGDFLDTLLGFLFHLDNCAFLHLSNLLLTPNGSWTLQSIVFCKNLEKLQLDLIDLSGAMPILCQGLKHNTSLQCLIASRCGLNDDRLHELFTSLPKQLRELRIFGNKCREKGLAAITGVVHHSQHLKILDMSYQHVDPENSSDGEFDVSWLAGALHHNKVLKVLDLDNDGIDDGHLTHLCAALCSNDTLEELMLNHNRITATGITLLSSKFGEMKGLKKISMYSNLFDAPVVDAMVAQNVQPMPQEVEHTAEDDTSDLEDEFDEEIDYDEETVVEESDHADDIGMDDDDDDDNDNDDHEDSSEGNMMSDDSSAPPPSADFREPEEVKHDSFSDDEEAEQEDYKKQANDDDDKDDMDDDSSAPPSSADFRESDDDENDSLPEKETSIKQGTAGKDGGESALLPLIDNQDIAQVKNCATYDNGKSDETDGENNKGEKEDGGVSDSEALFPLKPQIPEKNVSRMHGQVDNNGETQQWRDDSITILPLAPLSDGKGNNHSKNEDIPAEEEVHAAIDDHPVATKEERNSSQSVGFQTSDECAPQQASSDENNDSFQDNHETDGQGNDRIEQGTINDQDIPAEEHEAVIHDHAIVAEAGMESSHSNVPEEEDVKATMDNHYVGAEEEMKISQSVGFQTSDESAPEEASGDENNDSFKDNHESDGQGNYKSRQDAIHNENVQAKEDEATIDDRAVVAEAVMESSFSNVSEEEEVHAAIDDDPVITEEEMQSSQSVGFQTSDECAPQEASGDENNDSFQDNHESDGQENDKNGQDAIHDVDIAAEKDEATIDDHAVVAEAVMESSNSNVSEEEEVHAAIDGDPVITEEEMQSSKSVGFQTSDESAPQEASGDENNDLIQDNHESDGQGNDKNGQDAIHNEDVLAEEDEATIDDHAVVAEAGMESSFSNVSEEEEVHAAIDDDPVITEEEMQSSQSVGFQTSDESAPQEASGDENNDSFQDNHESDGQGNDKNGQSTINDKDVPAEEDEATIDDHAVVDETGMNSCYLIEFQKSEKDSNSGDLLASNNSDFGGDEKCSHDDIEVDVDHDDASSSQFSSNRDDNDSLRIVEDGEGINISTKESTLDGFSVRTESSKPVCDPSLDVDDETEMASDEPTGYEDDEEGRGSESEVLASDEEDDSVVGIIVN